MVESASGIELKLASGQIVIDACGGAAVALIGHGNEEVTQAMVGQARKVSYVHTQAYTTAPAEELADIILKGNPYGLEKAFFVGSGSEAVESALKLARQYFYEKNEPKRVHLISRQQSYHGNTMAAMSISTNQARKAPYQGFCYPNVSHVSPAYAYQYKLDTESEAEFTERLLAELDAEMLRVGPETVAAFIAETVSGATLGCVAAPEGYFRGVRGLCDKYGILLFLDEMMCGVGRTGTYFAFEQEGVVPDVVTIAKGLGGGYAAIAGVLMHERVVDALRQGSQGSQVFNSGHTYQAHPISCAAALAVQRIVQRDGLVARCAELGRCLGRLLREGEGLRGCRSVGDIRGRGLFSAGSPGQVRRAGPADCFCKGRCVAVYPGAGTVDGVRGDHVLVAPPFTVTEPQLGHICRVLTEAVQEAESWL